MQKGKLNIVIDGMYGSTSKGKISTFLADYYSIPHITTTSLPNAGHTAILGDRKFVGKALPAASILKAAKHRPVKVYIGPSAGFEIQQLFKEMKETGLTKEDVIIHPRTGIIQPRHKQQEAEEMRHIGSTMQGCGAMLREKIKRGKGVKLARDFEELEGMVAETWTFSEHLMDLMDGGATILHEGAQGFSLDIHHGHSFPTCTSRQCTALTAVADLGIAPQYVGDIYLVIRANHAIRVGNIKEAGKVVGYSGDVYPDQEEVSWDEIKKQSGCPDDHNIVELTTVTRRVRRCFSMSWFALRQAVRLNGATKIAVNFANYVDWSCYRQRYTDISRLPSRVVEFVHQAEAETGVPVVMVGTGPEHDEMVYNPESI
jgi:adenylosuccinate synthase